MTTCWLNIDSCQNACADGTEAMAPPLADPSPEQAEPSAELMEADEEMDANTASEDAAATIEAGQEGLGKPAESDAMVNDRSQDEV